MHRLLICISLLLVPLLPYSLKEPFVLLCISAFAVLIQLQKKEFTGHNKWLTSLMVYLPVSFYSAPQVFKIPLGAEDLGGSWSWKALAWCFGYYMTYLCISRISLNERHKKKIALCVVIPAVISALYGIVQSLNIDQWQYCLPGNQILGAERPNITAVIGNATYLGTYLSMSLPFVWAYARKWTALIVAGIIISGSDTAILGILAALVIAWLVRKNNKILWVSAIAVVVVSWSIIAEQIVIHQNGRLPVWENTLKDSLSAPVIYDIPANATQEERNTLEAKNKRAYTITGRGLGSFAVFYTLKHGEPKYATWKECHNEYLETFYSIGAVGLFLVFMAIGWILWKARAAVYDKFFSTIYISSIFSVISAITLPVWHQNILQFYIVFLFSMLSGFIFKNKWKKSQKK